MTGACSPASVSSTTSSNSTPSVRTPLSNSDLDPKRKCINFLKTLLKLAKEKGGGGGGSLVGEVTNLVSGLLGGSITPDKFTEQIYQVLSSKPQPHLVAFLTTVLPDVQKAYFSGELSLVDLIGQSVEASPLRETSPAIQNGSSNSSQPSTPMNRTIPAGNAISFSVMPNSAGLRMGSPVIIITSSVRPQAPSHIQPSSTSLLYQNSVLAQQLVSGISNANSPMTSNVPLRYSQPNPLVPQPQLMSLTRPLVRPLVNVPTSLTIPSQSALTSSRSRLVRQPTKTLQPPLGQQTQLMAIDKEADEDFNDVAAMGGVNLAEESHNIMAATSDILSMETRSCGKEDDFLRLGPLAAKVDSIAQNYDLQETSLEVLSLISHAVQERLKDLVEKLSVIAEHRMEPLRNNPFFEQVGDVRAQLRFLDDLSKKHFLKSEEREKEMLLKMAKSKSSKSGDPEQKRLKERAKEFQRAEEDEVRNREANTAAQLALSSSRKRPAAALSTSAESLPASGDGQSKTLVNRPRYKRVNLRDLQVLLSRERDTRSSKTYLRLAYK